MAAATPDSADVLKAMDIYLQHAYDGKVPVTVRSQQQVLEHWGGNFYSAPIFSKDAHNPPTRYAMRLGNCDYPHMKLAIELAPDDKSFLFRVDTHDRHVCPPEKSPEYPQFCRLMETNQRIASSIESEWERQGLPTFKSYLREDLKRRQEEKSKSEGNAE